MNLAQVLSLDEILLELDVRDAAELFARVAALWEERTGLSAAVIAAALAAREALGTTGLGKGIAIPHARLAGLDRPFAAFARTRRPLAFDAPDGEPVSMFFLLVVPIDAAARHLEILAEVAGRFAKLGVRERLAGESSPQAVLNQLIEDRGPSADRP